jgi:signal transduction histidine kinase
MKLLHRTSRDFLLATVVILVITGIALYLLLKSEVQDEMEEQLALQAEMVSNQVREGKTPTNLFLHADSTTDPVTIKPVYGDTQLYDLLQKKPEDYHYLVTIEEINGQHFRILVMSTYVGWKKYSETIFFLLLAALVLLGLSGVLINYFSNKKIWKPFFLNIERLKKYSVSSADPIDLHDSSITEFKELQHTLRDMTARGHREYMALREFTENASHEIQTPLGIIQSKLDRLSQLDVTEEMAGYIVQAKSGVERLSKMNKNLLLLAKLDNQAFDTKKELDLREVINSYLAMMDELFAAKELHVSTQLESLKLLADPYLCEVLISNLFSNALRYTGKGGKINIQLMNGGLTISNEGKPLDFPADQLFNRFKKSTQHVSSTGLGLAIVQQVCRLYGWQIKYSYQDDRHVFQLFFH